MSTRTQTDSYRPEIDGLHALAVIAVMLFHAKIALSGGYVGVDFLCHFWLFDYRADR